MKYIIIIATTLLFNSGIAQSIIPEPEFSGRPYFLKNETLKSFEKIDATIDVKTKALGYGGMDMYLTAFEKKSNVRFTQSEKPRIIILVEEKKDPEEAFKILRQTKKKRKKDRRRFKLSSMALGGKARNVSENKIEFEVKKIRDGIYEIIINDTLEQDEYAIVPTNNQASGGSSGFMSMGGSQKIYCFGID
jgi:hypothetical protein